MRKWGFLGGTFDPVHNAHLALAHAALQALALDEVRWIPAGQPWQKQRAISAARHREAMVRLAIDGEPRFVLDRIELERPGPTYTVDTVEAMTAARPHDVCHLIIGADQYAGFHTWHRWQDLASRVVLAVANRPGERPATHPDVQRLPHVGVPLPLIDVSASDIRQRAAAGRDLSALVPPRVASYIENHGLYRAATGS